MKILVLISLLLVVIAAASPVTLNFRFRSGSDVQAFELSTDESTKLSELKPQILSRSGLKNYKLIAAGSVVSEEMTAGAYAREEYLFVYPAPLLDEAAPSDEVALHFIYAGTTKSVDFKVFSHEKFGDIKSKLKEELKLDSHEQEIVLFKHGGYIIPNHETPKTIGLESGSTVYVHRVAPLLERILGLYHPGQALSSLSFNEDARNPALDRYVREQKLVESLKSVGALVSQFMAMQDSILDLFGNDQLHGSNGTDGKSVKFEDLLESHFESQSNHEVVVYEKLVPALKYVSTFQDRCIEADYHLRRDIKALFTDGILDFNFALHLTVPLEDKAAIEGFLGDNVKRSQFNHGLLELMKYNGMYISYLEGALARAEKLLANK